MPVSVLRRKEPRRRLVRAATLALAFALAAAPGPARAAVLRVPTDFLELPNAIAAAAPGDTVQIIGNGGSTYPNRLVIDKDLVLEGGYRADFMVRDPSVYVSVVRDTSLVPTGATIRVLGTPRVVFDGIQVIGGQQGIRAEEGADLVIRDCAIRSQRNFAVSDSTVNVAGGGIRAVGGTVLIERTRIFNVVSITNGGGIALVDVQDAELREVQVDNNLINAVGRDGGGIWASGVGSLRILDSRISACAALDQGSLLYVTGGPVSVSRTTFSSGGSATEGSIYLDAVPSADFADCVFEDSQAPVGGGLAARDVPSLTMIRCRFSANYPRTGVGVTEGGGLFLERTAFQLVDCEFDANYGGSPVQYFSRGSSARSIESVGTVVGTTFRNERTTAKGAAWSAVGGDVEFVGCRFLDNDGGVFGGAMDIELGGRLRARDSLLQGNVATFGGAVAVSFTATVEMDHVTIVDGQARSAAAALYVDTGATAIVRNSILARAIRGDLVFCSSGTLDFANTDTWNDDTVNQRGEFSGTCPDPTGTNGNVSLDPLFCPPGAPDWCLQAGSPCEGTAGDGGDMGWAGVCCAAQPLLQLEERSWGRIKAAYRQGGR